MVAREAAAVEKSTLLLPQLHADAVTLCVFRHRMTRGASNYIYPSSCASPHETGLGNQIWTLTGWIMIAFSVNATLVLPPFVPYVHEPKTHVKLIPFADMVDAEGFVRAMTKIGIRCEIPDEVRHRGLRRAHAGIGWTHYKKKFALNRTIHLTNTKWHDPIIQRILFQGAAHNSSESRERARSTHTDREIFGFGNGSAFDHQFIASEVLRAFQPSDSILRSVHTLAETLRLPARYGCVHARIERDMMRMSNVASAITIADYARAVVHADTLVPVSGVYVASGEHVILPGSYIGPRWLQAKTKIDFDDNTSYGNPYTYLHASFVDFTLCRGASWFVGFCHSSFSRILAEVQHTDNDRGWTSVCPGRYDDFASSGVSVLHMLWTMCNVNRPLNLGSFGWSR